jgi:hypothetical protein
MKNYLDIFFLFILVILGYSDFTPQINFYVFRFIHVLVLLFLFIRSWNYFKYNKNYWIINPLFTTLIFTFGLSFGLLSNFIFFEEGNFLVSSYNMDLNKDMYWYKVGMVHIGVAGVALIYGHESNYGFVLFNFLKGFVTKSLSSIFGNLRNIFISKTKILFLYFIINGLKLWQFKNGIYGRLISEELLKSALYENVSQYINLLNSAGLGAFFFITFMYHQKKIPRFIFILFFFFELFWGFLSGSRGGFLFPVVIVMFSSYLTTQQIKKTSIILFTAALFFSMVVVVPFKNFYQNYRGNEVIKDFGLLYSKFYTYYSKLQIDNNSKDIPDSWHYTLLSHTNYSTEIAASIRHKELYGLDNSSPDFFKDILLSPIHSIVPRFILQEKSKSIHGLWFREKILKHNVGMGTYSIAMTPIGYLYFAGGPIMVFLGFWIMGILQKSFFLFLNNLGIIGLIFFLIMMSKFYYIDSAYHSIFINYIRNIFISIFSVLLFCREKS